MNLRIPEDLGSARSCAAAWPAIEEAFENGERRKFRELPPRPALMEPDIKGKSVWRMVRVLHDYGVEEDYLKHRFGLTSARLRQILGDGFDQ